MMKDVLRNGPASVEFQTNKFFKGYRSGIISEKAVIGAKEKIDSFEGSPAKQELADNLKQILGELGANGNTDVGKVL
jgi:hypothetical protein